MIQERSGLGRSALPREAEVAIPGLRFRLYAGPDDLPGMVDVINAANVADDDMEVTTVQSLGVEYANPTNSDPYVDVTIAQVDGATVAYSRVAWEDLTNGGRSYECYGFVAPAWRRRGLGGAMVRANEARLRQIAAGHEADRPRWLASWGADRDEGNVALMRREGYVMVRHFYEMVRPTLDDIRHDTLPTGLEVRPAAPEHIRPLFDADAEAFRDHWGGVDTSEAAFRRWTDDPRFDPSLFVVAWEGDQIAAGVFNVIDSAENEKHGYARGILGAVFTRRPWRRRGLARALISRSFELLRERGMTSAVLGVDATNPNEALRLYESSGFAISTSYTAYRKPIDPARGAEWEALQD